MHDNRHPANLPKLAIAKKMTRQPIRMLTLPVSTLQYEHRLEQLENQLIDLSSMSC